MAPEPSPAAPIAVPPTDPLAEAKAGARQHAFAKRRALAARFDAASRAQHARAHLAALLARFGKAPLAGYLSIRNELDPLPVMAAYPGPVAAPVITGKAEPLVFRRWWPGVPLAPGPFGVAIPAHDDQIVPQVLIVPLLAWDRRGYRLGYGGGYYDRTLAVLRKNGPVFAIGFAYAEQALAEVPAGPKDQRLDCLVCEEGVVLF